MSPWMFARSVRLRTAFFLAAAGLAALAPIPVLAQDPPRVATRPVAPATPPPDAAGPPEPLSVDVAATVRGLDPTLLGVNVNYLLDDDANRRARRPLSAALRDMGAGSLRYPGGAKSDVTLWSAPPFTRPRPTLARLGPEEWPSKDGRVFDLARRDFVVNTLDFDEFMGLARRTRAMPVLVVAHDAAYRPGGEGAVTPTREDLLQNAVSWVRYANVERQYGVKYWELGNESYLYTYDGGSSAEDYARDLTLFARAMKAVDPDIRIGANGPPGRDDMGETDARAGRDAPWWPTVFALAGREIDFVSVHEYPCMEWHGYDFYRDNAMVLRGVTEIAEAARRHGPPGLADRLEFLLTEINSADWYGQPENLGWKHDNTLGHALVLFDMLGQALSDPRVVTAQIWATRWMENAVKPELWDALDGENRLLPTGVALSIWRRFLGDRLVAAAGSDKVRVFATMDDRAGVLTIFCLNKDTAREVEITVAGGRAGRRVERHVWSGAGPDDPRPVFSRAGEVQASGGRIRLSLPEVSLTALRLPLTPDAWPIRAGRKASGKAS